MFQAERRAYARVVSCEKSGITGKSERQSVNEGRSQSVYGAMGGQDTGRERRSQALEGREDMTVKHRELLKDLKTRLTTSCLYFQKEISHQCGG